MQPTTFYLPIVAVICGGEKSYKASVTEKSYDALPRQLGEAIAARKWNLLTGGGTGAMYLVTEAYNTYNNEKQQSNMCHSLAMLPENKSNEAGAGLELRTSLPGTKWDEEGYLDGRSRNHLNIRLADVVVALPGGPGTQSELTLAVRHKKPCIAFLKEDGDRIGNLKRDANTLLGVDVEIANSIAQVKKFFVRHAPTKIGLVGEGE